MIGTKLIRLISVFSKDELQQMELFLQSPLFNNGSRPRKVLVLIGYLIQMCPDFNSKLLNKVVVFQHVFPNENFVESKLDKLAAETVKAVRSFISVYHSGVFSEEQYWLTQLKFFRGRGLDGEFRYALEQLEKSGAEKGAKEKEKEYYLHLFRIEAEKVKYLVNQSDKKGDVNIPKAIQNLDLFYIISKLEYCSYLLFQSILTRIQSPLSFLLLDEVLKVVYQHFLNEPVVAAYYYTYSLLRKEKDNAEEDYSKLKTLLEGNSEALLLSTLKAIHSYMRAYIADRYNQGETECLSELFLLFKEHTRQGTIYQEQDLILAGTVQNAVTVALKLGQHDWAVDFLQQHRRSIVGANDPEAIYHFNLANCLFHKGDFDQAERLLTLFTFKEMFYKLAARRLEIKLHYETQSPLLDARLDAFKNFLHEIKPILQPDKILPNNHFTDLMRQMLSPKTLGNKSRIKSLIEKIQTQKSVAEREWLLQKLEEQLS
jgi:hypothetical protein